MNRRNFVIKTGAATAALALSRYTAFSLLADSGFPSVRKPKRERNFTSRAVEDLVAKIKKATRPEIGWLFENCFPNTLDTTVDYSTGGDGPDTFVITGDIDAMWLRDSSAQVWPYLSLCREDEELKNLLHGVLNRQVKCILKDPYANAFYKNEHKTGEWATDLTDMKPGIHERKWEIDSLCYPIRLAHGYWKATDDLSPFGDRWLEAMGLVIRTFREQQRYEGPGPYHFMRKTEFPTDSVPLAGYGYPALPNGLICSMFRPSDDATIYPYLIPSNIFAFDCLGKLQGLLHAAHPAFNTDPISKLMKQIATGLENAKIRTNNHGDIFAYEINGYGSCNLMDDANVPSLLSLSYLVPALTDDPVYRNTRKFVLSADNPFFFKGTAAEGIGGPHAGLNRIWPISIMMRGITSENPEEIKMCIDTLCKTHAGTGFMHESFHKDNAADFTRPWFAWANSLFGEFIWKIYRENPSLLA